MSSQTNVLGDVTYLDHAPEELPPLPKTARPTHIKAPSIKHLEEKFAGKPPSKSAGVNPDNVDDYYGQFYCPVNQSDTREVDFRATRFNSDAKVVARLSKTIASIKAKNSELRQALQELNDALEVLKRQRDSLVELQGEMADLEAGVERMAIDD
ncbi:hypothetical protein RSAG8_09718, partial [Rhizoctonia solani AG-8 WAC10335]